MMDIGPLKVLRMKDRAWLLEVDTDPTVRADFPGWRAKHETLRTMPVCIRSRLSVLLHLTPDPDTHIDNVGSRASEDVFWLYLTRKEVDNVTPVTLS